MTYDNYYDSDLDNYEYQQQMLISMNDRADGPFLLTEAQQDECD